MDTSGKEDENFIVDRKPGGSPWKQQQLSAFQPILTPRLVIIIYLLVGLVFIPLGIVFLTSSDKVIEVRSDSYANFNSSNLIITFENIDMQPPIYMYYALTDFYQNHRRYVKSRCDEQLRGQWVEPSACRECAPYDYFNKTTTVDNFYYPCGLIVKNVFNDTFLLFNETGGAVPLSSADITWSTDINQKFNNPPANDTRFKGIRTVQDVKNPDFINWMRTAAFPTFRKLYRIINVPLKGNYTVRVTNNFNVSRFNGKKYVVLSTSWLGGKNNFLGITYIIVGSFCIILAAIFFLKNLIKPRLPGDVQYLEWTN